MKIGIKNHFKDGNCFGTNSTNPKSEQNAFFSIHRFLRRAWESENKLYPDYHLKPYELSAGLHKNHVFAPAQKVSKGTFY